MQDFIIIDPNGIKRRIPYDDLGHALESGAKFSSKEDQQKAIGISQIKKQYPTMPNWLMTGLLSLKDSPVSKFAENVKPITKPIAESGNSTLGKAFVGTGIPSAAAGLLQGASYPIRGVSGLIPTEFTQNLSNAPDFTESVPKVNPQYQDIIEKGTELAGGIGPYQKLYEGLSAVNKGMKVPEMLAKPLSLFETGAIGTPGNTEERTLSGVIGTAIPGAINAVKQAPKIIKGAANKLSDAYHYPSLQKEAIKAAEEAENASHNLSFEQGTAHGNFGSSSPNSLSYKSNNMQKEIDKLESDLNKPIEPFSDHGQPPSIPEELTFNETAPHHESLLHTAKQKAADAEEEVSKHLNKGAMHDVHLLSKTDDAFKNNKQEISHGYKKLHNDLENIKMPSETGENLKIIEDLKKVWPTENYDTPSFKMTVESLSKSNPETGASTESANDYLTAYRNTKDLANDANKIGYDPDTNAIDKITWQKKGRELNDIADKMKTKLESVIGDEHSKTLNDLSSRWKNEVAVLYKNPLYNRMMRTRQWPENMMKALRGDESGNMFLKSLIMKDPESLKHIMGQRFAKKPIDLHEWDELSHEYRQKMPDLESKITTHKNALSEVKSAESNLLKAKESDSAQKSAVTTRNIEIKKASAQAKKYEKQKENNESERIKNENKRQEKITKKEQHEKDINEINETIKKLESAAKEKDISLKEKIQREDRVSKAKNTRKNLLTAGGYMILKNAKKLF